VSAASASAPLPFGARRLLADIGIRDDHAWVAIAGRVDAVRRKLPDGRTCVFLRRQDSQSVVMAVGEVDPRHGSWTMSDCQPSRLLGPYLALFRGWRKPRNERR